mmetsp:Transcript_31960/g.72114  ORF Transcript_31960/g.72114 Transcript_31960/m.72114 type:complete len:221 (+) Transcript_31960:1029-1691(+)
MRVNRSYVERSSTETHTRSDLQSPARPCKPSTPSNWSGPRARMAKKLPARVLRRVCHSLLAISSAHRAASSASSNRAAASSMAASETGSSHTFGASRSSHRCTGLSKASGSGACSCAHSTMGAILSAALSCSRSRRLTGFTPTRATLGGAPGSCIALDIATRHGRYPSATRSCSCASGPSTRAKLPSPHHPRGWRLVMPITSHSWPQRPWLRMVSMAYTI